MSQSPQIVVGAGIVVVSIAWHLASAGARVTVLEAGEAGGAATANSFAWINASWGNPEPSFRLRIRSMQEWRRLAAAVPALPLAWMGGLFWKLPTHQLQVYVRENAGWGYGRRQVEQTQARRIEPNLSAPPALAVHVPEEGAIEPHQAARALLADAEARGAEIRLRITLAPAVGLFVADDILTGRRDALLSRYGAERLAVVKPDG